MDLLNQIRADLNKGFTKSDLERLIGLPKNTLTEVLKGNRKLSKKSIIKVGRFMSSIKPDPFNLPPIKKEVRVQDLNKQTGKIEPKKPLGSSKSNFTIDTAIPPQPKKEDFKDSFEFAAAKNEWKLKYNQQ